MPIYFEYHVLTIYLLGSVASRILEYNLGGGGGTGPDHTLLAYFHIFKRSSLTTLLKPTVDITPYRNQSNRWMFNAIQDILLQQVPLVMVTLYHTQRKEPWKVLIGPNTKKPTLVLDAFSSLATNPTPIIPGSLTDSRETWSLTTKCRPSVVFLVPPTWESSKSPVF